MKPVVPTSATIANAKPAAAQAASQQRVSGSDVLSRFIGGAAEFQALIQALQLQLEKEREELQQERDKASGPRARGRHAARAARPACSDHVAPRWVLTPPLLACSRRLQLEHDRTAFLAESQRVHSVLSDSEQVRAPCAPRPHARAQALMPAAHRRPSTPAHLPAPRPGCAQVVLNVGGTKFATTLYTLRNAPESLFTAMFSGRHALKTDEEGCFFIDRCGPAHAQRSAHA